MKIKQSLLHIMLTLGTILFVCLLGSCSLLDQTVKFENGSTTYSDSDSTYMEVLVTPNSEDWYDSTPFILKPGETKTLTHSSDNNGRFTYSAINSGSSVKGVTQVMYFYSDYNQVIFYTKYSD